MNKTTKLKPKELVITVIVAVYNLVLMFLALMWIFTNRFHWIKIKLGKLEMFDINENVTYGIFLSGVLGGTFYCLRALYQRIGETYTPINGVSKNSNSLNILTWFFWYFYRPIQGGVLALILMVLFKGRLIHLSASDNVDIDSYYTLIGVGFLAGFGTHEVIHKLLELIQVLFAKSKNTGSNSSQKVLENNETES